MLLPIAIGITPAHKGPAFAGRQACLPTKAGLRPLELSAAISRTEGSKNAHLLFAL